ncbi:MAG: hypothetical protein FWF97_02665 [Alphaproteobacteria bacterium]|nr:hypothetical protein [Alphaproteobacteria bacterium]
MIIKKWEAQNAGKASVKTYEEWGIILSMIASGENLKRYDFGRILELYVTWEKASCYIARKFQLVTAEQSEK